MIDNIKTKPGKSKHWLNRAVVLAVLDFVFMVLSFFAALLIRYDLKFHTKLSDEDVKYIVDNFTDIVKGLLYA